MFLNETIINYCYLRKPPRKIYQPQHFLFRLQFKICVQTYCIMATIQQKYFFILLLLHCLVKLENANAHAIGEVHSDLVVTKFGPDNVDYQDNVEEPGWMVRNKKNNFILNLTQFFC